MPINFFIKEFKSQNPLFGICDESNDTVKLPAYLDEQNQTKWIAEVHNNKSKEISFFPIDNCVEILRENGEDENRCDGLLKYEKDLIFVELKNRGFTHKWVSEGANQLSVTFNVFKQNYNIDDFFRIRFYICNGQRPKAVVSCKSFLNSFKQATGLEIKVYRLIEIK